MTTSLLVRDKQDGAGGPTTSPVITNTAHSSEFASAHAQLTLIGEAIRAAASDLAVAPSQPLLVTSPSPSSAAAAPPSTTAKPAVVVTASERLAALHDNLRRVQQLMKEYETVSQRAVEMHLLPSADADTEDGALGSGISDSGRSNKLPMEKGVSGKSKGKALPLPPEPPSPSRRNAPQPARAAASPKNAALAAAAPVKAEPKREEANGKSAEVSAPANTGPSLQQQRALASDAAFTRFCGLRVDPEHLMLPWAAPTTSAPAFGPGGGLTAAAALRLGQERGTADLTALTSANVTALDERPGSSSSISSQASTGSSHSLASVSLRAAQQQRQQAAATAHISAYARFFLHPSSPVKTAPAFAVSDGAAAADVMTLTPAATADPVNGPGVLLKQLKDTQSQFEALRRCRLFHYEEQLRQRRLASAATDGGDDATVKQITGSAAAADEPKWEHTSVLIDRVTEVLAALRQTFTSASHYAYCGPPAVTLGRQLHAWTQPLLRQLNELLSNPTLEDVDEDLREKLHRMKFDVEELQQAQRDAIADGDMQRSEELYYEQTALAEAMKDPYDEMEQLMQEYVEECVTTPLAALQDQKETLTARLTRLIEEHTGRLTEVAQDIDRIKEKRRAVIQSRQRQRNATSTYQHAWRTQWLANSDQQMACYRAMEQLERRLSHLQKAQGLLVDDWLTHMTLERQREEDAAAFSCFAEAHSQALAETQTNLQAVVDGLRQFSGAIHFGCSHAEAFARDVLEGHIHETQLALRKDRLAQFRTLYLTLGDLRFKKARNAEEIQKKIEYYTLQQEVAMDALNPKAKEYSQAKQQWEAAKVEALAQVDQLDDRSRLQLEAFKPTEQLLRSAGVDFVSPEDELAERNLQRTLRLVEYQQLIEEGIGVREPADKERARTSNGSASAGPAMQQRLPAIMPSAAEKTPAITRPFTGGALKPSPPPSTSLKGPSSEPRRVAPLQSVATPSPAPVTATSTAAPPRAAAELAELSELSSGRGAPPTLPPVTAARARTSPLPPPRLHSTEEQIMRDISKTAGLGNGPGSGRSQKRKSTN